MSDIVHFGLILVALGFYPIILIFYPLNDWLLEAAPAWLSDYMNGMIQSTKDAPWYGLVAVALPVWGLASYVIINDLRRKTENKKTKPPA